MQILIDLFATNDGIIHSDDRTKKRWEIKYLLRLLLDLEQDGYKISPYYGFFAFNEAKKEVIYINRNDESLPISYDSVESILERGAKFAVIFIDQKRVVFTNRYFIAIHFCHMRRVRPISIYTCWKYYFGLVKEEDQRLLDDLYLEQFEFVFGKDAEPEQCIKDSNELISSGIVVPGPDFKNEYDK